MMNKEGEDVRILYIYYNHLGFIDTRGSRYGLFVL